MRVRATRVCMAGRRLYMPKLVDGRAWVHVLCVLHALLGLQVPHVPYVLHVLRALQRLHVRCIVYAACIACVACVRSTEARCLLYGIINLG